MYVRLCDLDIPREKWLNQLQTVETLIRRRVLRRLIWVCTVCQLPFQGSPVYNGLKQDSIVPKMLIHWSWTEVRKRNLSCNKLLAVVIETLMQTVWVLSREKSHLFYIRIAMAQSRLRIRAVKKFSIRRLCGCNWFRPLRSAYAIKCFYPCYGSFFK